MRSSLGIAGLIVGAAMLFHAPPARAEFSMQILDNATGDGFKIQENATHNGFTLQTLGKESASDVTWSANSSAINATAKIDGYTFNVVAQSNQDASPAPKLGQVSMNAHVTAGSGAKATSFSYYVSDSPFKFPGTSSDKIYLTSSVFTTQDTNSYTKGNLVSTKAQYTAYGSGTTTSQSVTASTSTLSDAKQSSSTSPIAIATRGTQYAISDLGGVIQTNGNVGQVRFWSQAVTAMPEPTGVLLGALGLPCMAVIVVLARRRARAPVAA